MPFDPELEDARRHLELKSDMGCTRWYVLNHSLHPGSDPSPERLESQHREPRRLFGCANGDL